MNQTKILYRFFIFLAFLVTPRIFVLAGSCDISETEFACVDYIRNTDGDTVYVDIPGIHPLLGESIAVRISGIDTGEVRNYEGRTECEKEMAIYAKQELEDILSAAKSIELIDAQRGKYFRILAEMKVDGKDVGKFLIKKHLAVAYHGGPRGGTDWCKKKTKYKRSRRSF